MAVTLPLLLGLLSCRDPGQTAGAGGDPSWAWGAVPGDPIPGLDAETLASYHRGRAVLEHAFRTDQGLGPSFNTDACQGCHQAPGPGGSAPRYRDFWLVRRVRWDGALEDVGTNGLSPVRNLYATAPTFHLPEPSDTSVYARRNAPPGFGVGLFIFVSDADILALEDPDDADGDGISGRANFEQGMVGRFGYKAQASRMESFNRGAMFNQMGITSNPLLHVFPGEPSAESGSLGALSPVLVPVLLPLVSLTARAQVSAPGQPTTDDDLVADPEMSDAEQLDLLVFSTFLAALPPGAQTQASLAGRQVFQEIGCAACHVPTLPSTRGPLQAWSDLLLHDMGPELADGIGAGLATGQEFRTQPLWGVTQHAPYLHDGRADTLEEAIEWHGGEGQASRDAWRSLPTGRQAELIAFLEEVGGGSADGRLLALEPAPPAGAAGGPLPGLDADQLAAWERGRVLFDDSRVLAEGLGTWFNADSCRACHQDPVLGGAGGIDTSVLRYGSRALDDGAWTALDHPTLPRSATWGHDPRRLEDAANVVEARQPPTLLGLGLLDTIPDAEILAGADPDDADGDGISGRARILSDGRLGRFGWKAQVPSLVDFVADALLNEVGLTSDPAASAFTLADDGDDCPDPEQDEAGRQDLVSFLALLAPPPRTDGVPEQLAAGEALFQELGCAACHLPSLGGVAAWTDLLVHDVAPDPMVLVEQEDGLLPSEYRTPPLWGVGQTPPYLHDGSAPTLHAAITEGHAGEAETARQAFLARPVTDQAALIAFLSSL